MARNMPDGPLTVAPLTAESCAAWAAQLAALDAEVYSGLGRRYAPGPWHAEHFLLPLPGKWELSQVCFLGDRPAGFWIVAVPAAGRAFVYRVAVAPALQHQGLGRHSFAAVRAALADYRGAPPLAALYLEVSAENEAATAFYRGLGFAPVSGAALAGYLAALPPRRVPVAAVAGDQLCTADGHRERVLCLNLGAV